MKKFLLTLTATFSSFTMFAQFLALPNSGFENWTSINPDGWFTNNVQGMCVPLTKTTDAHSGSFAIKGEVQLCDTTKFAPSLGTYGSSLFNVTQRYSTLNFFYKFNQVDHDVIFLGADIRTATGYPIAVLSTKIITPQTGFTPVSIPFNYFTPDSVPAKLAMLFGIEDSVTNSFSSGSYFIIDDISLGGFIGIDEINSDNNIQVFNNTANDFISFSLPEKNPSNTISLTDATGKQTVPPFHSENSLNRIPTADLANGIYFLSIVNEKNVRMKKVVITH